MEREISEYVSITVTLIMVSIVIGVIFLTTIIGRDLGNTVVTSFSSMNDSFSISYLEDIERGIVSNEMPTATAYNIIRSFESVIEGTYCHITGEERLFPEQHSCLTDHLGGRVILDVEKRISGLYYITIRSSE